MSLLEISPAPLAPGEPVEVQNRFDGSWCEGFEIAEVLGAPRYWSCSRPPPVRRRGPPPRVRPRGHRRDEAHRPGVSTSVHALARPPRRPAGRRPARLVTSPVSAPPATRPRADAIDPSPPTAVVGVVGAGQLAADEAAGGDHARRRAHRAQRNRRRSRLPRRRDPPAGATRRRRPPPRAGRALRRRDLRPRVGPQPARRPPDRRRPRRPPWVVRVGAGPGQDPRPPRPGRCRLPDPVVHRGRRR